MLENSISKNNSLSPGAALPSRFHQRLILMGDFSLQSKMEQLLKLENSANKYFMTWRRKIFYPQWKVCYQIISDVPIGLEALRRCEDFMLNQINIPKRKSHFACRLRRMWKLWSHLTEKREKRDLQNHVQFIDSKICGIIYIYFS